MVDVEYYEAFGTAGNTTDLQIDVDRLAVEVAVTDWSGIFPTPIPAIRLWL